MRSPEMIQRDIDAINREREVNESVKDKIAKVCTPNHLVDPGYSGTYRPEFYRKPLGVPYIGETE